jgi:hypothetical protein
LYEAPGRLDASGGFPEMFDRLLEHGIFVGHEPTVHPCAA